MIGDLNLSLLASDIQCDAAQVSIHTTLRLVLVTASIVATTTLISSSARAEEFDEPAWPGLPYLQYDPDRGESLTPEGGWLGGGQLGMAGSERGKQWAAMPLTMVATNSVWTNIKPPPPVPAGEPTLIDILNTYAFLVSPAGSVGGHNYGDSALIPVRTVAFGSIPVEATLQVSQLRDSNGIPDEFELILAQKQIGRGSRGHTEFDPVTLQSAVIVRLRKLVIDGIDVKLTDSCRTGEPATLDVASQPWQTIPRHGDLNEQFDPTVGMLGQIGGRLEGTIDIPAFTGCGTDVGDDLSGVVSSVLAGTDNPVTIQVGAQGCFHAGDTKLLPPGPGETTPEAASCYTGPMVPSNPAIKVIPDPLPFPDYAPGDQP